LVKRGNKHKIGTGSLERQSRSGAADIHVGNLIRAQREVLGMSQQDMAARIGVTFQQVQKYEKGVNRVSASRLGNIAAALRVDPSFFFPEAHRKAGRDPELIELLATHGAADLLRDFVAAPVEIRRALLAFTAQLRNAKLK
jgi:transcriptional regulator with XRE-family HTH domain